VRILVVDASSEDLASLREHLDREDLVIEAREPDIDQVCSRTGGDPDVISVVRVAWSVKDTDLCSRLSTRGHRAPVVALSARCDGHERARALRAGADDFLNIPFEREELVARVAAVARRAPARCVRAGALLVDLRTRAVSLDGQEIALTPHEYDLFVALVERIGEVVSRQDLANLIDRERKGRRSNVVDVHISRLRAKLGTKVCRVEAARGQGYRLRLR
jgi:DNA-binding response OmpR family regulator